MLSLYRLTSFVLLSCILPLVTGQNSTSTNSTVAHSWDRNSTTGYGTITTSTNGSVVTAVVNNPPIQLYDYKLVYDFHDFVNSINNATEPPKVVVISSAVQGYWIHYLDIHVLSDADPPPPSVNTTEVSLIFHEDVHALINSSTIFIAEMNGRAFGAGNEIALACDMRFAGPDLLVGTIETAIGITHANDGIQYLTNFLGRGRAMEYLLSAGNADAQTAERIGWVNTAYSTAEELSSAVSALAQRIALFPMDALVATKTGVNRARPSPAWVEADLAAFVPLLNTDMAQNLIDKFLNLTNDLSPNNTFNLGLTNDIEILYETPSNASNMTS